MKKKELAQANSHFFSSEEEGCEKRKEVDPDYDPNPVVKAKLRNRTDLTETALACDRAEISSRKASLLCNSYAKDCGFLTHENRLTATLDASKLDQWRKKERQKAKERDEAEISSRPVKSCYFDGKKQQLWCTKQGKVEKYSEKPKCKTITSWLKNLVASFLDMLSHFQAME